MIQGAARKQDVSFDAYGTKLVLAQSNDTLTVAVTHLCMNAVDRAWSVYE
jgi:hypothetical protein